MSRIYFRAYFALLVSTLFLAGCGGFNGVVAPTLSSIDPTTVAAGSASFTLTATGTNYVTGTTILWNGAPLTTTVKSATQLTATVSAAQIATAGTVSVSVRKPDTTTSGTLTLTVTGSGSGGTFSLNSISPSAVAAGSPSFTLTATGVGFVSGAAITLNGTAITTSFDSATQLHATVDATAVATAGTIAVGVTNADGTASNTLTLTVTGATIGPAPTLTSISPNSSPNGITNPLALTATGTGFVNGSQILWNGAPMTTTFVSSTQLMASIPASYFVNAYIGTSYVLVLNPDSTASNELPFTITLSASTTPTLTTVANPSGTQHSQVGDPGFTLTLTGTLFATGAKAFFGTLALPTTVVSSTQATAQVPASALTAVNELQVTIQNPSSKPSNAIPYYVGMNIYFDESADVVWDSRQNLLYVSKPTTSKANADTIMAFNPLHLTDVSSIWIYKLPAGSNPDRLSLSADGKYLYAGLDGTGSVQQLAINGSSAPTAGSTVALGSDPTYGPYYAMDLQVSPVSNTTIAVARGVSATTSTLTALGGVAVYDGTVQRPNVVGYSSTNPNLLLDTLQWNASGTTIYAANNEKDSGDLYQLAVSASGVALTSDTQGVFINPNLFIHFDAGTGKIYGDDGIVVDPASPGVQSGFTVGTGVLVPDDSTGNAYFIGQPAANFGTVSYLLQSFSLTTLAQVSELSLYNVQGIPQHMVGFHLTNQTPVLDGLAFSTKRLTNCVVSPCSVGDGRLYVVDLPF